VFPRLAPRGSPNPELKKNGSGGRTRTDNLAVNSGSVSRPLPFAEVRLSSVSGLESPSSFAQVRPVPPALLYKTSAPKGFVVHVQLRSTPIAPDHIAFRIAGCEPIGTPVMPARCWSLYLRRGNCADASTLAEVDDQLTEILRSRWARARSRLGLADVADASFGRIGFGQRLGTPSVRLIILPRDPDSFQADFNEEFWEWWRQARPDPASGGTILWGARQFTSIEEAAVAEVYDDEWEQYLAVHRSAGLDLGLGGGMRFNRNDRGEPQGIQLIKVVGRIWAALAAYHEVLQRYAVDGPWQVALALVGVGNSQLGLFANGWDSRRIGPPALELRDNQLFCLDVNDWPDGPDGVRQLALRLGAIVADAWDLGAHPFLALNGPNPGEFDRDQYRRA
jgi:hypothetical protein